jgi:hypothetical protein
MALHVRRGLVLMIAFAVPATFGAACASGGGSAAAPAEETAGRGVTVRESGPDYVTQTEIEATPVSNAYDLITRLRPRWLQLPRSASMGGGTVRTQVILVYLDGSRIGTVDALRSLTVAGFRNMRYYDAVRAATVLRDTGTEPVGGAIVITTRAP